MRHPQRPIAVIGFGRPLVDLSPPHSFRLLTLCHPHLDPHVGLEEEKNCRFRKWQDARTGRIISKKVVSRPPPISALTLVWVDKVDSGVGMSVVRWLERVTARLNRLPVEVVIALESGLIKEYKI